jgi:hypothetical protein
MPLTQAAEFLGVAAKSLRRAVENREISALHPLPDGPWIFNRSDLEASSTKQFVDRVRNRTHQGAGPTTGQLPLGLSTT